MSGIAALSAFKTSACLLFIVLNAGIAFGCASRKLKFDTPMDFCYTDLRQNSKGFFGCCCCRISCSPVRPKFRYDFDAYAAGAIVNLFQADATNISAAQRCASHGLLSGCCSGCLDHPPNRVPESAALCDEARCEPECCCADPDCAELHGLQFQCSQYRPMPITTTAAAPTTPATCKSVLSVCNSGDICCAYGPWPGICLDGVCAGKSTGALCTENSECWSGSCGGKGCSAGGPGSFCKPFEGADYCASGECNMNPEKPDNMAWIC